MERNSTRRHDPPDTYSDGRWREARLRLAGFDRETAEKLGFDETVDLHALLTLVDRGCPPHLAARILAPLDTETSP
jgi:hypothetical protein